MNAFPGGSASAEAQAVMKERGLSLNEHQSRSITAHGLQNADLVLTMTKSHRNAILDQIPEIESKVHLVSGASSDVSDPFGGPKAAYSACADQVEGYLGQWMDRWDDLQFSECFDETADYVCYKFRLNLNLNLNLNLHLNSP